MATHHSGTPFFLYKGERISFEKLYEEHWKMLCAIGNKITGSQNVTKDIVQDVFVSFLEKYEQREIENVSAYLVQALRYKCFQWLRNEKIADKHIARVNRVLIEDCTENDVNVRFLSGQIEEILAGMPERPQQIFRLSRFENLPNDEIAARLNLNKNTVENHLTRALHILRLSLKTLLPLFFFLLTSL